MWNRLSNQLRQPIHNERRRFLLCAVSVFFAYTLTHAYRFFHGAFAGDALLMIYQNDAAWQIALGRFFQPILLMLRGGIETPFLISALAMLYLSIASVLLCRYLALDTLPSLIAVSALLSCNLTLIVANASFLPWVDLYALALLLAILGVVCCAGSRPWQPLCGILLLALSLGIYQAYICAAVGLVLIRFLLRTEKALPFRRFAVEALRYLISFAAAFLLYYLLWKLFQRIFHIWTADSYNGLASVGDYAGVSIPALIASTYRHVWDYLWQPEVYITMTFREISLSIALTWLLRLANLTVLFLILTAFFRRRRQAVLRPWQWCIGLLLLLLFPLGINLVCILSKDMEHTLMIYAFCLIYVLALRLWQHRELFPRLLLLAAIALLSWTNIVYANQLYLKRELQEEATHSLMTRIVYEIEHTERYRAGETPVAFSGSFEAAPYTDQPGIFSELHPLGVGKTVLTYSGTDYAYLEYILNVPMNLTRVDAQDPRVLAMPCYPAPGSIAYIDDILVIRIAEL